MSQKNSRTSGLSETDLAILAEAKPSDDDVLIYQTSTSPPEVLLPSGVKARGALQAPTDPSFWQSLEATPTLNYPYYSPPTTGQPSPTENDMEIGPQEMDSGLPWEEPSQKAGRLLDEIINDVASAMCSLTDVNETLKARQGRYGKYSDQSRISYGFLQVMEDTPNWDVLNPSQKYSLHMIGHKMARILNGDPDYDDNWRDIAGYAELILKQLNGEEP